MIAHDQKKKMQQKSFLELQAVAQHVERMANRDRRDSVPLYIFVSEKRPWGCCYEAKIFNDRIDLKALRADFHNFLP